MNPTYVIDTNALIDLDWRTYPCANFNCLWDFIATNIKTGKITVIDKVYEELGKNPRDDTFLFAKGLKESKPIRKTVGFADENITKLYDLLIESSLYRFDAIKDFVSVADGWLVAYAATCGLTVVTGENKGKPSEAKAKNQKRVKIPDACLLMKVNVVSTLKMIEEPNFREKP